MTEFRCFLDTHLLVYLYSNDQKSVTVEKLIHSHFNEIDLSIQVLNELYSVLTRKNLKPKEKAQIIVNDLIENYRIYCLDEPCIQRAIKLNIHYDFFILG